MFHVPEVYICRRAGMRGTMFEFSFLLAGFLGVYLSSVFVNDYYTAQGKRELQKKID
jgi:hypothetical protein